MPPTTPRALTPPNSASSLPFPSPTPKCADDARLGGWGELARRSALAFAAEGVGRPIPSWVRRDDRSWRSEVLRCTRSSSDEIESEVTVTLGEFGPQGVRGVQSGCEGKRPNVGGGAVRVVSPVSRSRVDSVILGRLTEKEIEHERRRRGDLQRGEH